MRFPFIGGNSGVADTREDEDILRLTGRTKRMVGVFAKPAHSQDWAGFLFIGASIAIHQGCRCKPGLSCLLGNTRNKETATLTCLEGLKMAVLGEFPQ
jgi:hypothetical protein